MAAQLGVRPSLPRQIPGARLEVTLATLLRQFRIGGGMLGVEVLQASLAISAGHDFQMEREIVLGARFEDAQEVAAQLFSGWAA